METLLGALGWLVWTVLGIVWWIVTTLFWVFLWLILPLLIVAFVALRIAESALGKDAVRGWLKAQSLKFGAGTWVRVRRLSFALTALPLRVSLWFIVYAVWHALVSLIWRPKWSPWRRAWAKRWKPVKRTPSGRRMKEPAKNSARDATAAKALARKSS
jgi:hypothetical protein